MPPLAHDPSECLDLLIRRWQQAVVVSLNRRGAWVTVGVHEAHPLAPNAVREHEGMRTPFEEMVAVLKSVELVHREPDPEGRVNTDSAIESVTGPLVHKLAPEARRQLALAVLLGLTDL